MCDVIGELKQLPFESVGKRNKVLEVGAWTQSKRPC